VRVGIEKQVESDKGEDAKTGPDEDGGEQAHGVALSG
jgi:hypothetical protein